MMDLESHLETESYKKKIGESINETESNESADDGKEECETCKLLEQLEVVHSKNTGLKKKTECETCRLRKISKRDGDKGNNSSSGKGFENIVISRSGSPTFYEDDGERGKRILKKAGKFVLTTAAVSGAVIGGITVGLPLIGFGSLGPIAGSLAATYQSTVLGGTIASGSAFATLQSIGMAGLSVAAKTGIVAGSAAVSAAAAAIPEDKNKKKE